MEARLDTHRKNVRELMSDVFLLTSLSKTVLNNGILLDTDKKQLDVIIARHPLPPSTSAAPLSSSSNVSPSPLPSSPPFVLSSPLISPRPQLTLSDSPPILSLRGDAFGALSPQNLPENTGTFRHIVSPPRTHQPSLRLCVRCHRTFLVDSHDICWWHSGAGRAWLYYFGEFSP